MSSENCSMIIVYAKFIFHGYFTVTIIPAYTLLKRNKFKTVYLFSTYSSLSTFDYHLFL